MCVPLALDLRHEPNLLRFLILLILAAVIVVGSGICTCTRIDLTILRDTNDGRGLTRRVRRLPAVGVLGPRDGPFLLLLSSRLFLGLLLRVLFRGILRERVQLSVMVISVI